MRVARNGHVGGAVASLLMRSTPDRVALRWTSIPSRKGGGGVEILLVASCYRNRNKLRPNGPLGS